MQELIPIVDKNDRVMRYAGKKTAHKQDLCHREVVVYLTDPKGHLLIQKRDGGFFDHSVAGHVRARETYLNAALRELDEEVRLKLQPKDLKKIGKFWSRDRSAGEKFWNNRFFALYVAKEPLRPEELKINRRELETMVAFTKKEALRLVKNRAKKCKGGFIVSLPLFLKSNAPQRASIVQSNKLTNPKKPPF